ncbi:LPS assembly lipoprotein LptE [Mesorhizobium sp. CN5-321]|jgi:LPS-assembly lipoprotein|uniref:LPS assembly lipoprotein LptE n=1 Tax=Mesorhizobium hunchu TaxID=3157708 RepID=UPI0032B83F0D
MSLPETRSTSRPAVRRGLLAGVVLTAALASACTVRPLYSNAPLSPGSTATAQSELASIAVKPVTTRYAQQVRNNLIFAFTGGKERTDNPLYSLDLNVTELVQTAATVQISKDQDQPTAGTVTLTSRYRLTDAKTGKVVSTGTRSMSASYDKPNQEFASYRAQLDAENRAARELAEILNLAIAQDLAKR